MLKIVIKSAEHFHASQRMNPSKSDQALTGSPHGITQLTSIISAFHFKVFFSFSQLISHSGSQRQHAHMPSGRLQVSVIFVSDWSFFHLPVLHAHLYTHSIHSNRYFMHVHIQAKETNTNVCIHWNAKTNLQYSTCVKYKRPSHAMTDVVSQRYYIYIQDKLWCKPHQSAWGELHICWENLYF